nr:homoserine/homoserine lactone efflux protein [Candidatus Pantoea persica]
MEQHIARVQGGWVAEHAYMVKVLKAGQEQVVDNRQGTISWLTGRHGNIITASDKYTSMGKLGFTDTTDRYDAQLRLIKSVSRGNDALSSGESRWR